MGSQHVCSIRRTPNPDFTSNLMFILRNIYCNLRVCFELSFYQIYLDENLEIKNTECECPRGEFKCSHAAAIFIYGIHNLSRTDLECQWKRKRKAESVQSASQMFPAPPKKKDYSPLARDPSREDRMWLYSELKRYGKFTGTCWILSPEPQPATPLYP